VKALIVAGLAVGAVMTSLLMPLPARWHGNWQGRFFDLGHVPLFALLTLVLWRVLRGSWHGPVLVSLALAALAEVVQGYCGRSASFLDFVRGALGVGIAVVMVHGWRGPRSARRLATHGLAALGLLAWPVWDAGPHLLDAYEGWRSFPTLADFRTSRQTLRWDCQQALLERLPDQGTPGGYLGRINFLPGPADYPGAVLQPVIRDFTAFRRLCWSIATADESVTIVFSVRSARDNMSLSDHYQFARTFAAGAHRVVVDLAAVAPKAQPGPLDLSNVVAVQVFVVRPERAVTMDVKRIWLE